MSAVSGDPVVDLAGWWQEVTAAALVGTARRPVPALPARLGHPREGAPAEVALLDAAALGGVARRVRAPVGVPTTGAPAEPDRRAPAPPRAAQLLDLVLHQSPVGPRLSPRLLEVWLAAADTTGHRLPHQLVPELLDLATTRTGLRPVVACVADARGAWLAAVNPAWAWVGEAGADAPAAAPTTEEWALLTTAERETALRALRRWDPARARALLESTWAEDAAAARASLLATLSTGLGPDDEPLLERALDDRSARVREIALGLLDRLPTSARAHRMADRLRPLLKMTGRLRKGLEVELPTEPDAAGVRDGLVRPRSGSARESWLRTLAAGAPLDVWTDATGTDPVRTWRLLAEGGARAGIRDAVLGRRDAQWAPALLDEQWTEPLLALLPPEQRDAVVADRLARTPTERAVPVVAAAPGPWGPRTSRAVLQWLAAERSPLRQRIALDQLTERLATSLDPLTRPAVERWAAGLEPEERRRAGLVVQYLTLVPEITEAFA